MRATKRNVAKPRGDLSTKSRRKFHRKQAQGDNSNNMQDLELSAAILRGGTKGHTPLAKDTWQENPPRSNIPTKREHVFPQQVGVIFNYEGF